MKHFKTISSISPHEGKLIMDFASKGLQIPSDDFKIDSTIPGYDTNSINPKLDDIIGATIDQYKLKDLINSNKIPDDLYDLDPTKSRLQIEKNPLNRLLWKVVPKVQPDDKPGAFMNYTRALAVRKFLISGIIVILKQLTKIFINLGLKKLAVTQINKDFNNGKFYNWFGKQIQNVYDTNPDYEPVPINEFVKTSIWQRNAAEWRDKNKNQIIRQLSKHTFTAVLMILCSKVPLPGNFLYTIPARIILAYVGCSLAVGSIYSLVVQHGNNSVLVRITLTKYGFELSDPELFVKRKSDGKLVRVILPDVPKELYAITKEDLKQYKKEGLDLEQLKKKVAVTNDRT